MAPNRHILKCAFKKSRVPLHGQGKPWHHLQSLKVKFIAKWNRFVKCIWIREQVAEDRARLAHSRRRRLLPALRIDVVISDFLSAPICSSIPPGLVNWYRTCLGRSDGHHDVGKKHISIFSAAPSKNRMRWQKDWLPPSFILYPLLLISITNYSGACGAAQFWLPAKTNQAFHPSGVG